MIKGLEWGDGSLEGRGSVRRIALGHGLDLGECIAQKVTWVRTRIDRVASLRVPLTLLNSELGRGKINEGLGLQGRVSECIGIRVPLDLQLVRKGGRTRVRLDVGGNEGLAWQEGVSGRVSIRVPLDF